MISGYKEVKENMSNNDSGDLDMQSMTDRRKSELYRQVCGYIPRELYKQFKAALALREIPQNEALEAAIRKWLEVGDKDS